MFVDDDELILTMGGVTLRRLGYEAAGFREPRAAIEAFGQSPGAYHLVICDVRLGAESGLDLARALKAIDPQARVLLVSGAVDPEDAEHARRIGALALLPKAQVMTDLGGAIRRFLDP